MRLGIILGGGGEVGIAWETAVLAALTEHAGLDVTQATAISGTSAGAFVAALAATGHNLGDLTESELTGRNPLPAPELPTPPDASTTTGTSTVPEDITRIVTSTDGSPQHRAAAVGQLALEATPVVDEATYLGLLRSIFPPRQWPADPHLYVTATDCHTGETALFDRSHGIDLPRAIAASCAVPGYFPPISHNSHYCDAPRAPFCAQLVERHNLDRVLFIGPRIPILAGIDEHTELDALARQGAPVVAISEGPDFAEVGTELMDAQARPRAAEIGLADGQAAASQVQALLS